MGSGADFRHAPQNLLRGRNDVVSVGQAGEDFRLPEVWGVSEATLYTSKSKYGGLEVNEARRLRELEDENRRLKHMVADLSLDKEALTVTEDGKTPPSRCNCPRLSYLSTRSSVSAIRNAAFPSHSSGVFGTASGSSRPPAR